MPSSYPSCLTHSTTCCCMFPQIAFVTMESQSCTPRRTSDAPCSCPSQQSLHTSRVSKRREMISCMTPLRMRAVAYMGDAAVYATSRDHMQLQINDMDTSATNIPARARTRPRNRFSRSLRRTRSAALSSNSSRVQRKINNPCGRSQPPAPATWASPLTPT